MIFVRFHINYRRKDVDIFDLGNLTIRIYCKSDFFINSSFDLKNERYIKFAGYNIFRDFINNLLLTSIYIVNCYFAE